MSKSLKNSYLSERAGSRTLLAVALCTSMVAFGCTTNRNVGSGGPVVTPGVRTVPTGGTSSGSESDTPPPMMSAAPEITATLQAQPRVRYLGPAAPAVGGSPVVAIAGTELRQPFVRSTINSSIYSQPTAVVSSGAGEPAGGDRSVEADFLASAGQTTGTPVVAPNAAPVVPTSTATPSPAANAVSTPPVTNAAPPSGQ